MNKNKFSYLINRAKDRPLLFGLVILPITVFIPFLLFVLFAESFPVAGHILMGLIAILIVLFVIMLIGTFFMKEVEEAVNTIGPIVLTIGAIGLVIYLLVKLVKYFWFL